MSRIFLAAFAAGVVLALLSTTFWPLPDHVRHRSIIGVEPDGGRQEDFFIRWPEDRLRLPGREAGGTLAGAAVLEDSAGQRVAAEIFRVRDAEDNVIGVAGRTAAAGGPGIPAGRSASQWILVIPSRGALYLSQQDSRDVAARAPAGQAAALAPGQTATFWGGSARVRITAGSTGRVVAGTAEFGGLTGNYTETWDLEEVNADGTTRGRIVLSTITALAD